MKKVIAAMAAVAALSMMPAVCPGSVSLPIGTVYADGVVGQAEMIQADGYGSMPAGMPAGRAKLMARRAAVVDAQRNLVETIKGTAVNAETTMENYMVTSDLVKTKVNGVVTGARVVSESFEADGTYHVVMSVPMYGVGSVADAAISAMVGNNPPAPIPAPSPSYVAETASPATATTTTVTTSTPAQSTTTTTTTTTTAAPIVAAQPTASVPAPPAPVTAVNGGYTGLIIDARGYDMVRAFGPGIYDTNNRAIYTVHNVDESYAIQYGIVGYAEGSAAWAEAEAGRARAGSHPLIIKIAAPRQRVVNNCDVIISPQDADRILAENQKTHFLEHFAVTFEI